MKKMVCEMCGESNIQKEEGIFVCKDCGCKYSLEDAKKLMVEVEADDSSELSNQMKNLYERARKSLEVDDLEHAAEYYKQILDEEPHNWEAYFYSYLGEYTSYTNAQAASVALKLGKTIPPAYDMAIEGCEVSEAENRIRTITTKTVDKLSVIGASAVLLIRQYEGGNILTPTGKVHHDMYNNMRPTVQNTIISCVTAYDPLDKKLEEISNGGKGISDAVIKECMLYVRKKKFELANVTYTPAAGVTEKLLKDEVLLEYAHNIQKLEPNFEIPSFDSKSTSTQSGGSSGGCYVATAVYGSYDCPQVWTLRRYRDYELAETWYGRGFIHTYYAISPTIVKWFGHTEWFKRMWRGKLDRMVKNLQEKGYESTPYEDRNW